MDQHPFAKYVRILGRGRKGARSLSEDEAYDAMHMILDQEVEPEQLGAFLMLMRVKEESPEELAGFVRAARDTLQLPATLPEVLLDWSSYAGKRRQLPWFVLSALLLAENGVTILMHGTRGNKDNRLYTPDIMAHLSIPVCATLDEAATKIEKENFAFIDLENFSPVLKDILNLRGLLGLRSPINTLLRMLNPFRAPHMIQGIFHPGYRQTHQEAALLLGQPHMAVFKGDGGEIERNPDAPCQVLSTQNGRPREETWPAKFKQRHLKDDTLNPDNLLALWRGESDHEYGSAAVIGTMAIALRLLGRADESMEQAEELATEMWLARPQRKYFRS